MTAQDKIRHDHMIDNALAAIYDVFSDSNIPKEERIKSLEKLRDSIEKDIHAFRSGEAA